MKFNKQYSTPYRDVFHDVPVEYVQKIMKDEKEREEKRKKGKIEKLLLFLKLKKPWTQTQHIIYNNCTK